MTKAPTPTEKSKKQRDNNKKKNATKNFDYTTIADRLRTVSWSNSSHPTGMVKPVVMPLFGVLYSDSTISSFFGSLHEKDAAINSV